MVSGALAIGAAIGLVVLLLEAIRYRRWGSLRRWQPAVGLGLAALAALGAGLGQLSEPIPLAVLLGGLVGLGLLGLSGCGRAGQGLAVLLLSLASVWGLARGAFEESEAGAAFSLLLWGCGLGMGLVGIPLLGCLAEAEMLSVLMGLGQGWSGIAALTWGSRLLEMGSPQDLPWSVLLPVGLAALSLVAGTLPLLILPVPASGTESSRDSEVGSNRLLSALGHGVGWLVATALALALVRNGLYQDPFWALLYGAGVLLSWALLALEGGIPAPEGKEALLWRACVSLTLVGGGALLALRLGGSYGAALLGLGCLAFPSRWGAMAALFLSAQPLLQNLLHQFNLQVAGIDLTQPYVAAALYLGMASMGLAALVHWVYGQDRPLPTGIGLTLASLLLPLGVGYFVHAQPQAAFLLAALITALILAALQPIALNQERGRAPWTGTQALGLAMLAILGSNLSRNWTVTGFYATRLERALVLVVLVGILVLCLLLGQGWRLWQSRTASR
ncbi:hypothetical protein ACVW0Q_000916 [Thermostichus sp. MS-CIW-21]|jgi:hypothetical protein|uniref:hypothetical protein n=1 Tax=unclassified Synechococcus TaxID=2626047 RepID=UPI0000694660|nr:MULTISPECIES: hypothetical protein [unclassified Synechococcus]ABD00218.1 putative membrane protein [Synechococcus sp. JA-3-3Ab]PIK86898.1 hypothetical protein SYN63AY4M2_11025 [Synechococcus sp. 63AY4M2]PIK87815.1 hypothetical protein SYN65AY6A5_01285 [Synechococcus sp. 65AY6A5]PIK92255.1 hypothetical protein SYN65AY6LI_08500 [Synechococcus sp. 65AY6Li]PIK95968.1 hypothetical protein SYN60AY4M2_11635 [Synechococcus sp. 60AY4M2]